jgi:hypothetical protein
VRVASQGVTTSTASIRTSTWRGIAVGLVLLGLLAAFAIGLPKAAGDDAEQAEQVELSLPDTLPGGYAAADLADSFGDGELAEQAEAIAEQQAASAEYGNEVLPDALGHPAVTRSYVVDESEAVFVQVFQSEGGALAPNALTDPATTDGAGGVTMEDVGGAACILTYGQSEGEELGDPTSSQCQLSRDGLTVQVQSNQVPAEDLVELADAVLDGYDQ